VVALRGVFDAMAGDVPFTELQLFGGRGAVPLTGLGGARSIRGLPRLHYIGKVKALANVELRSRVLRFTPGSSTLDFWLVGFVDAGRVWTDLTELLTRPAGRIHGSAGGGLRLAWVEDYVVRVDYGWSNEGTTGLYIGFEQTF
jgi:hemolysin activation/secretion protein